MNVGLIFGMIVAIFTITLILVFGFEQLTNVGTIQEEAEFKQTIRNLENAVNRVYSFGGETSEELTLVFPSKVEKVCFIPLYRGVDDINQKEAMLMDDLRDVLGSSGDSYTLAELLTGMRIKPGGEDPATPIDHGQTLLLFYRTTSVPEWYYIEHLEPTKICPTCGDQYGTPICVKGSSTIWLQRSFDESGAWVEVQEA